jgi:hypothetical protein
LILDVAAEVGIELPLLSPAQKAEIGAVIGDQASANVGGLLLTGVFGTPVERR